MFLPLGTVRAQRNTQTHTHSLGKILTKAIHTYGQRRTEERKGGQTRETGQSGCVEPGFLIIPQIQTWTLSAMRPDAVQHAWRQ